jgi:hypothetical protein
MYVGLQCQFPSGLALSYIAKFTNLATQPHLLGTHVCLHAINGQHSEVGSVCVNNISVSTQLSGAFGEN